jgi:hypothetical protein
MHLRPGLRILLLCVVALAGVGTAAAMMAPAVYREARQTAPYHVQVAISRVAPPAQTPGSCVVEGKVVRIFRDEPKRLADGAVVRFGVACNRPTDPPRASGILWTDLETLAGARYIEAYLVDDKGGFGVTLWQSRIIDAPSRAPQLPVDR